MSFIGELSSIAEEFESIKKEEATFSLRVKAANEVLQGFLRRHGLPDNFSLPEALMLAATKAKEGQIEVIQ